VAHSSLNLINLGFSQITPGLFALLRPRNASSILFSRSTNVTNGMETKTRTFFNRSPASPETKPASSFGTSSSTFSGLGLPLVFSFDLGNAPGADLGSLSKLNGEGAPSVSVLGDAAGEDLFLVENDGVGMLALDGAE
jgi:hypothetical protein